MAAKCHRIFILALTCSSCLVSSLPNIPRTNTHFTSRSFASPNEDPSLMGGSSRPSFGGGPQNAIPNSDNGGGSVNRGNHFGNEGGFNGLRDEWNNNYRSNNLGHNERGSQTGFNRRPDYLPNDPTFNGRGSHSSFNRRPDYLPNDPTFNTPTLDSNGRGNEGAVGGSMPGITPHRMGLPNPHIRPPTPQNYSPISASLDPNEPIEVEPAFKGCEKHRPSRQQGLVVNDHYETPAKPMEHNSHIAVYPLTDDNPELMVKIMMPSRQYQVTVQGTNVVLEKCDHLGAQCNIEDEKATKTKELISPQKWNYIHSHLDSNSVTVGIGAEVEVMSMRDIPAADLDNAEWLVMSGDGGVRGADGKPVPGGPFVVEYPCAEFVAAHLPDTPSLKPNLPETPSLKPYLPETPSLKPYLPETPSLNPRTDYPPNTHIPTHPGGVTHSYSTDYPSFTGAVAGHTTEKPETGGNPSAALIVGVIGALVLIGLVIAIIVSVVKKRRSLAVTESTPLSEQKRSEASVQQCEQKVDE